MSCHVIYMHIQEYPPEWASERSIERQKLGLLPRYKFLLSFENTITNDYVTEKFFQPIQVC